MKCKNCGDDTWVGVESSLCDNCCVMKESLPVVQNGGALKPENVRPICSWEFNPDANVRVIQADKVGALMKLMYEMGKGDGRFLDSDVESMLAKANELEEMK
jgi:hypothetical protein